MDNEINETICLLQTIKDKEAIDYIYLIVNEIAREQAEKG